MTPILLRAGFDTVEYAVPAIYPAEFYNCLATAKEAALASRKPHPTEFNGEHFFVYPSGGQGGYEYLLGTGPFGATIKIRGEQSRDAWSTHIKLLAHGLATKGLKGLKSEVDDFLLAVNADFNLENMRMSRLDYALDFYAPGLEVRPEHVIAHARTTKAAELSTLSTGNRTTYLRTGKMPGRQVCIYDKSKASKDKRDLIWRDIFQQMMLNFGLAYRDQDIWRVEFRAGRDALDKYATPRFFAAALAAADMMYSALATSVRWVIENADTNRSRWPLHPIWIECQRHFREEFQAHEPQPVTDETRAQIAREYVSQLEAQTEGVILTLAATYGVSKNQIDRFVAQQILQLGRKLSKREDLEDQLKTRRERHALMFGQ